MFRIRTKRILYRIVIPYTFLFAFTTLLTWFSSAYFITRHLDRGLGQQMEQVTGIISQFRFILNPAILRQLKEVINADIVIFDQEGRILISTIPTLNPPGRLPGNLDHLKKDSADGHTLHWNNIKYRAIARPLNLGGQRLVRLSLWMPAAETDALRWRIILSIGGIAMLGLLAMTAIGYRITRSITAPLETLASVTERIAGGDRTGRAAADGNDEIGILASAFNRMLDELKIYEERLVKSEKLATAGRMAAGIAHEIRNPLTSIKMLAQLLHKRLQGQAETQEMIRSLVGEIDRLDRIIQELIDRTRPGGLRLQRGKINEAIKEVLKIAEEELKVARIVLKRNLAEGLPEMDIDREKLKQVLWNLILNAKEAMPGGGELTLSTTDGREGTVQITVRDTGMGISAANRDKLFQPFFTTKPEGLGLGLSMSRDIIVQHGGSLALESLPAGGTEAVIILPVGEDQS